MENVNNIEKVLAEWYKNMPHLPAKGKRWLADNAWWLTLIGVILTALSVFGLFSVTFLTGAVLTGIGGGFGAMAASFFLRFWFPLLFPS